MFSIRECLTNDSYIYVTTEKKKRRFFKPKEKQLYMKRFNPSEFIGEELCHIKNIECATYFLVGTGLYKLDRNMRYENLENNPVDIKIGSYDFKQPEKEYFTPNQDAIKKEERLDAIIDLATTLKNKNELTNEILEMLALDLFTGQTDRFHDNILFSKDKETGEVHRAPMYDFEYSLNSFYLDSRVIYENSFIRFKTVDEVKEFINKYPKFKEELASYLDIDLMDTIDSAYDRRNLRVPSNALKYYKEFEDDRKELIKQIIK